MLLWGLSCCACAGAEARTVPESSDLDHAAATPSSNLQPPPEYVCTPRCGSGEVCAPGEADEIRCRCHPALEPSADGCTWSALLADGTFESGQGWYVEHESQDRQTDSRIESGQLELLVKRRCRETRARSDARLPARDQFPEGAALVFDYSARGVPVEPHTLATVLIDGFLEGQPLQPAEASTDRRCVPLRDQPWLASLEFLVQVGGNCGLLVDYALSVDNIRLEADPSCR